MLELTQKSERTIRDLQQKVGKLTTEMATHQVGVEEMEREHKDQLDNLTEQKTLLEVWMGLVDGMRVRGIGHSTVAGGPPSVGS